MCECTLGSIPHDERQPSEPDSEIPAREGEPRAQAELAQDASLRSAPGPSGKKPPAWRFHNR